MALNWQLKQLEEHLQQFNEDVTLLEERNQQALPVAAAQLAIGLANDSSLKMLKEITEREDFDPNEPSKALSFSELQRLPEATLVVNLMGAYITSTLRLQNKESPRVSGGVVTKGRL